MPQPWAFGAKTGADSTEATNTHEGRVPPRRSLPSGEMAGFLPPTWQREDEERFNVTELTIAATKMKDSPD